MVIPDKAGPGVIMLQNGEWAGLHIAIKSHKVQAVSLSTIDTTVHSHTESTIGTNFQLKAYYTPRGLRTYLRHLT